MQSAIARRYLSGTDGLSFRTVVHSNKKVFLFDDLLLLVEQSQNFFSFFGNVLIKVGSLNARILTSSMYSEVSNRGRLPLSHILQK